MTATRPLAGTGLPAGLAPPVKVALARAVTKMPRALPGKLIYEPKWDGYRAIGIRDNSGASLWSRQGKDLTGYSVGVKRRRAALWPSESAVTSARQVSQHSSRKPSRPGFGVWVQRFDSRIRCRTFQKLRRYALRLPCSPEPDSSALQMTEAFMDQ